MLYRSGFAVIVALFAVRASAIDVAPPAEGFLLDQANMLNGSDAARVAAACMESLKTRRVPVFVVTIDSMAAHGGAGMDIETFTQKLYDQWAPQLAGRAGTDWKRGILLVVSRGDRKARIEFGKDWQHREDATAMRVMNEVIVPRFKKQQFSRGIAEGAGTLASLDLDAVQNVAGWAAQVAPATPPPPPVNKSNVATAPPVPIQTPTPPVRESDSNYYHIQQPVREFRMHDDSSIPFFAAVVGLFMFLGPVTFTIFVVIILARALGTTSSARAGAWGHRRYGQMNNPWQQGNLYGNSTSDFLTGMAVNSIFSGHHNHHHSSGGGFSIGSSHSSHGVGGSSSSSSSSGHSSGGGGASGSW